MELSAGSLSLFSEVNTQHDWCGERGSLNYNSLLELPLTLLEIEGC